MKEQAINNRRIINHAKNAVALGWMTYDEAREYTKPAIDAINAKSRELAKKYDQKPRLVSFSSLMR